MSLTWHTQSFSIILGGEHNASKVVDGLVDNLGLFGIHFADALHGSISVTELASGYRIHPEPGFPTIGLAARFAERVAHLDFSRPREMRPDHREFLYSTYQQFIIGGRIESTARN